MDARKAARALGIAAALVCGVAWLATIAWALATLLVRPLDGVEGDVLFEANRIRAGYPLWVDPSVGAHEYGEPPARYLVLYPPVWSSLLSLFPRGASPMLARVVATLAWLGAPAWIVWRSPPERRRVVAIAAIFVTGSYTLTLFGASGRPDALAVALSAVALERASRLARIDTLVGALFALAAWTKPNVVGAAPGAFLAAALLARRASTSTSSARAIARGVVGASFVTIAVALVLARASGGVWLKHLLESTGQPPSVDWWLAQLASRGPFFLVPLAAALAIGWRSRRDPGATIATLALATSTAWCLLSLAKIGSASNYFMEPLLAALVVLSRADLPALTPRVSAAAAALAVAQTAWVGVASARSAAEGIPRAREQLAALTSARELCGAGPTDLVLADEPGLELMLDGRVIATPFQSTHLARRGLFPIDAWIADVERPEVRCLVMQDDLLDRPLDRVDPDHDRFGPELRRTLASEMSKVGDRGGLVIYARRPRATPSIGP
ncbi:MAG TPA: hypothetical protein VIF62_05080 [Labilithrix sp.]